MAPATSVARIRKQMFDRVERGEATVVEACGQYRLSRSRFYELRHRYRAYGEAGLLPKPRPLHRRGRRRLGPHPDVPTPTEGFLQSRGDAATPQ